MFWRVRGRISYVVWPWNVRLIVCKDTQLWRDVKRKNGFFDVLTEGELAGKQVKELLSLTFNPNQAFIGCTDFVYCWAYSLSYSWRCSGLCRANKTGKMATSKQKMDRKRWEQLNMFESGLMTDWGLTGSQAWDAHKETRHITPLSSWRGAGGEALKKIPTAQGCGDSIKWKKSHK